MLAVCTYVNPSMVHACYWGFQTPGQADAMVARFNLTPGHYGRHDWHVREVPAGGGFHPTGVAYVDPTAGAKSALARLRLASTTAATPERFRGYYLAMSRIIDWYGLSPTGN